jgi:hypothetical protein
MHMNPSRAYCSDATIDFGPWMSMLHLVSTIVSRSHQNYPGGQEYITDKSDHISKADRPRIFAHPRQLSHDCLKTALVNIVDSPNADCGLLEIGLRLWHNISLSEGNAPWEYFSLLVVPGGAAYPLSWASNRRRQIRWHPLRTRETAVHIVPTIVLDAVALFDSIPDTGMPWTYNHSIFKSLRYPMSRID